MLTKSQEIVREANIIPSLQLAVQKKVIGEDGKVVIGENGKPKMVVVGTGKHWVKFISDKGVKGREYQTGNERSEVQYIFEEKGQQKKYNVPVRNENGEVHYFVQRMADVEPGEEIVLEYQTKGARGFIMTERVLERKPVSASEVKQEDIPVIEERGGNEGIDVKNIPF